MADNNIVEFGISDLYIGTYSVGAGGTVTLGTPYHQAGAVSLSVEPQEESNEFYADNVIYWSGYSNNGFSGELEVARFDTDAKKKFFGYRTTATSGIAQVKTSTKPKVFIAFETQGDAEARRVIMYNVALGNINREFSTITENKEPVTETCDITVIGDNGTGITIASYKPGDASYSTLFTAPPTPALSTTTT